MVKKKVVAPALYVHQAAPVIHRNISTTADDRRLRNDTNLVDLSPAPVSPPRMRRMLLTMRIFLSILRT